MTEPIWLSVARAFVGITETPGPASTRVIMRWAADIQAPAFDSDAVAWCAVGMNRTMLAAQLPMAGTGYDLLRARSFLQWGQPLPAPALGAVLVFQRPDGFHVGLYIGERADAYYVLGFNQRDTVGFAWIRKDRLRGIRWAAGVALPAPHAILLASSGEPPSANEA